MKIRDPQTGRYISEAEFDYRIDETTGCWIWQRGFIGSGTGYGELRHNGTTEYAHRYYYEIAMGSIEEGKHLHHTCNNSHCVNPEHLLVLSPLEHGAQHRWKATHCPHGHPYDVANTGSKGKIRWCRTCARERMRRYK